MMYTLKVNAHYENDHAHYAKEWQLLEAIDRLIDKYEHTGRYITFSIDGACKPLDKDEMVLTVFQDNEVICPTTAGGTWDAYDQHRKEVRART